MRPPSLDPGIFERNIAALRGADAVIADQVALSSIEVHPTQGLESLGLAGFQPAITRDDLWSFQRKRPDGSLEWFGHSSIPKVRATALLEQFEPGNANVLLPGIGEGTEATMLTQRLGRHRAVFVWEESHLAVHLALRLRDLSNALEEERLIFLICPVARLGPTLIDRLKAHPGHLCPNRLMMWPWQSPADIAPIRSAVETAYQHIEQHRRQSLARLSFPPSRRGDQGGALAIMALHSHDQVWTLANVLAIGAESVGVQPICSLVRTPADVHPLSRAMQFAAHPAAPPDFAILLDITRNEIRDVLPETVPAICWFGPRAVMDANLPARVGGDAIAVSSSWLLERAVSTGIEKRRISVCPPPCLAMADALDMNADRDIDVAILADLGPTDAASFGHHLPTHVQIWNTALDLLKARIEQFAIEETESLLTRAEQKSGFPIDDPNIRRTMTDQLRHPVASTLLHQFIAEAIVKHDLKIKTFGHGWPAPELPIHTVVQRADICRRCKMIVHIDLTGAASADALLAAGSGVVVLAREHSRDRQPGGLATLLEPGREMVTFSTARDLLGKIRDLLGNATARREIAENALRRCRADHTAVARIQTLRAAVTSAADAHPADTQPLK